MSKPAGKPYEVGYGKPPKSGQFKAGHSGFKKKVKKPPRLEDVLKREAARLVKFSADGEAQSAPQLEIVVRALFTKAMKGDVNAAKVILASVGALPSEHDEDVQFGDGDLQFLHEIISQKLAKNGSPSGGGDGPY